MDESATIVDKVTKEIDSLVYLTHLQDPVDVVYGSFKSVGLAQNCSQLGYGNGIRNIHTLVPTSPIQSSKTGRKVYPSAETVLVSVARDPLSVIAAQSNKQVTFAGPILTPIIATEDSPGHAMEKLKGDNRNTAVDLGANITEPITTVDEILGPDKGQITKPANFINTSASCKKSELILIKLWADALDSDQASDSTLDPDIIAEGHHVFSDTPQTIETVKKGKRGRPRKPKSPKALSGTKSQHKTSTDLTETGFDTVNTRSKHGVIKSNPKYGD